MALTHQAFFFDVSGFKKRVSPIADSLDSGTAKFLYTEALEIVQQINADGWILNGAGSNLLEIRTANFAGVPYLEPIEPQLDNVSRLQSCDLGYWLLIILSAYLHECKGIGTDFAILEWCLGKIGWGPIDIQLLIKASPTSQLLRTDAHVQLKKLSLSDPYWYWIRPAYANASGWLSQYQVDILLDKLKSTEQFIHSFDPGLFGNKFGMMPISVPDGQLDYLNRAQTAYRRALEMLEAAKSNNQGLYTVISET